MGKSLQEQLLGMGLSSEKKLKEVRKQQHQQHKQKKSKKERQQQPAQELLQEQRAEQIERDRQLNQQKQAEQAQKALKAQVRQLIEANREKRRPDADVAYHFKDGTTIKKLYVSKDQQNQLVRGQLSIVQLREYELVPRAVAEKILERLPEFVIQLEPPKEAEVEDDYYKQFEIPDDLMW